MGTTPKDQLNQIGKKIEAKPEELIPENIEKKKEERPSTAVLQAKSSSERRTVDTSLPRSNKPK